MSNLNVTTDLGHPVLQNGNLFRCHSLFFCLDPQCIKEDFKSPKTDLVFFFLNIQMMIVSGFLRHMPYLYINDHVIQWEFEN